MPVRPPLPAPVLAALAVVAVVAVAPEAAAQVTPVFPTPTPPNLPPTGPFPPASPFPPAGPLPFPTLPTSGGVPPPLLDTVVGDFRAAVEAARPALLGIASATFGLLAVIELALSGIVWTFKKDSWADVLGSLTLKLAWLGFAYGLIASFAVWFPPILEGFRRAGEAVAPGVVSPTEIIGLGVTLTETLIRSFFDGLGLMDFSFQMLGTAVFVGAACLLIALSYAFVAAHLVVVLVESFVALAAGALVLGFAAFRGTASLADRFVAYVFNLGIRIFSLFLIVGIGSNIVQGWVPYVAASVDDMPAMITVLAGSVTFAFLAVVVPIKVSSLLTRDLAVGFEKALNAA